MINIKARLKNKAFLLLFIPMAIAFVYQVLSLVGVTPSITAGDIESCILMFVELLGMLGIVIDPTTKGISDSERAMTYTEPN